MMNIDEERLCKMIHYNESYEIDTRVFSPNDFYILYNIAKSLPDFSTIIEIGSFSGNSTTALIISTIKQKSNIFCIDTWKGSETDRSSKWFKKEPILQKFIKKINKADKLNRIHIIQANSHDIKSFQMPKADLIFIDGDHSIKAVEKDIFLSEQCLKNDGILCGHDYRDGNNVKRIIEALQINVKTYKDKDSSIWEKTI